VILCPLSSGTQKYHLLYDYHFYLRVGKRDIKYFLFIPHPTERNGSLCLLFNIICIHSAKQNDSFNPQLSQLFPVDLVDFAD